MFGKCERLKLHSSMVRMWHRDQVSLEFSLLLDNSGFSIILRTPTAGLLHRMHDRLDTTTPPQNRLGMTQMTTMSDGKVGYLLVGLCCGTIDGLLGFLIYLVTDVPGEGGTHVPEEVEGQLLGLLLAGDLTVLILAHAHSLAQLVSEGQLQLVLTDVLLHLYPNKKVCTMHREEKSRGGLECWRRRCADQGQ